jgi:hypothetical protein
MILKSATLAALILGGALSSAFATDKKGEPPPSLSRDQRAAWKRLTKQAELSSLPSGGIRVYFY